MQIKNHKILHEIYRGAMTTVYKAQHLNLERPVLLKVLNKQWLQEQDLLERFQREARISAKLQHPNIVNVYDFEISEDLVYLSLEFVEGQTLQETIRITHPMPFKRILNITRDIASALDYAHQNGVIHRDIKPSNILLDENGNARLTDFGLASLHGSAHVTVQGQLVGTPAYMAPELIHGSPANRQSDFYSLGITLFEMLTATSPFFDEQPAVTLQNVMHAKLPDVSSLRDGIPENLKILLNALVQFEPAKRPKNAQTVLAYSQSNLKNQPDLFPPEKTKNSHSRMLFSALIICALFILSAWILWPRDKEKETQTENKTQAQVDPSNKPETITPVVE
ncbi:MAG: serine/threonine protein kinase, partial [Calditrichaeota bacterium]